MIGNGLRYAKVSRVAPKNRVDLVFLDDGSVVPGVQVLSTAGTTNTGAVDLAEPTEKVDAYGIQSTNDRDAFAVVAFMGGLPVVLGFLYPAVCQLMFEELNLKIERHASDWYTTVDDAGNYEAAHPSGTFIRIGETPAHRDLTGEDIDGKWAIVRNTDKAVHLNIEVHNAGSKVAQLHITPAGNVTLDHDGALVVNAGGAATVTVGGNATVDVAGSLTTEAASWTHNGPMTLNGNQTVNGTVAATGNVSSAATVSGAVVTGGGKNLATHTHGGVTTGSGTSGAPT